MKTSEKMAAYIAAKKAKAMRDNNSDIFHRGDLNITQYKKFNENPLKGIERMKIYKKRARGTRSISEALAAVYGIH